MKFSRLAKGLTGSATMASTQKAQEIKALGHDVVIATIGEPDGDVDLKIKSSMINHLATHPSHYGPAQGLLSTRQIISNWFKKYYGITYSTEQLIVTPGSKFGIYSLMQILCDVDDEVIIPAPYWVSYVTHAQMAGARPCTIPPNSEYKLDFKSLEKNINDKSRLLILNSPNNPSGAVYSKKELLNLYEVLKDHPQITIICDDIYNQLCFDSSDRAPSLLDIADDDFKKRIVVVHGVSKSYAMTGWRLGWIAASSDCIEKLTNFVSQTLTCTPDFIQKAAEVALTQGHDSVHELRKRIQKRYEWLYDQLQDIKLIKVYKSSGAFYIWINLLDKKLTSIEVANDLLTKVGLAAIPGEAFGLPYHLRLSVTVPDEDIKKMADKLKDFFSFQSFS